MIYTQQYVVSHCTACEYQKAGSGQAASSPPVLGGLVAQAFAVVIFGVGKFNIKWVLISIVKIWSKTCTSLRSISVSSKNGICCTCWRIFLENKAIWVWEFSIRSAVPSDRRSEIVSLYHVSCILVTSSTKSRKILVQQRRNTRRTHTIK
jgi:hypothetical protein